MYKWFQSGKICFRHQTPEMANTCSEFTFENVVCLQLYYFTFQSSTIRRAELCDSWSERGYIHMEGVFNKVENPLVLIHITESGFKFSPQLFQNINKSSVAEVLLQRRLICGDSSEFWEVNEFSVRYIQDSYFILECSDCVQHVAWKLISPLKLQVQSVQVTGDVSQKGCMIQCGSSNSGSCFPLLSRKVRISGRRLRNRSSTFPRDNHLTSLCINKSPYSVS